MNLANRIASIFLVTSSILLPFFGHAGTWNPSYPTQCRPKWEVSADFIYWKTCLDDLDYAASVGVSSGNTTIDYQGLCPEWESGARISFDLEKIYRDWNLLASYTFFNASSHDKATGKTGVTSPLVHPDLMPGSLFSKINGHYKLRYSEWDLVLASALSCSRCHILSPYFGVTGMQMKQLVHVSCDQQGHIKWKSDYWGVGLKAGSIYTYEVGECLSIFANANGSLVVGDPNTKNKQKFSSSMKFKDKKCCLFVPGYHIMGGVEYASCFCAWEYLIRFGYEFVSWYNLPNPRVFAGVSDENNDVSHSTSPHTQAIGFHGIFAGISAKF